MTGRTVSSREFHRNVSGALRAADEGPVFITDRGRPAHVLLSIEEYRRLTGGSVSIGELLALPGSEHVELEPSRAADVHRPADLS
ncbi:MAG: type II toxin-antitoxin system Phd/YefM family antitoxin [Alphaproteobacteria bacterium]|nr:type II toxin-antitoxin system Phd/YefM family antitoxin [Alphaproteobacteria bacterium]